MQPVQRHERHKPRRLQHHRLSARIGPGDDQAAVIVAEHDVVGHHAVPHHQGKQRVPGRVQAKRPILRHRGLGGPKRGAQAGRGVQAVEVGNHVEISPKRGSVSRHGPGKRGEDARHLLLQLHSQHDEPVVEIGNAVRLKVERRLTGRHVVHGAPDFSPERGLEEHHVALVAGGENLLLQVFAVRWRVDELVQLFLDIAAGGAKVAFNPAERGKRRFRQLTRVGDRSEQRLSYLVKVGKRRRHLPQRGVFLPVCFQKRADAVRRQDKRAHRHQLHRLERSPLHGEVQRLRDVGHARKAHFLVFGRELADFTGPSHPEPG